MPVCLFAEFLSQFAYKLPFCGFFRHVTASFDEFGQYLEEMVKERRAQGGVERSRKKLDLLGALIQSSEDADERNEKEAQE